MNNESKNNTSNVYIPVYARAPNKLLRYEERPFRLPNGMSGIERMAIFVDRNNKQHEMTAQVIWNNDKVIGYYTDGTAILEPKQGMIYTQAFILCSNCRDAISHCGGPAHGALCVKCFKYEFL